MASSIEKRKISIILNHWLAISNIYNGRFNRIKVMYLNFAEIMELSLQYFGEYHGVLCWYKSDFKFDSSRYGSHDLWVIHSNGNVFKQSDRFKEQIFKGHDYYEHINLNDKNVKFQKQLSPNQIQCLISKLLLLQIGYQCVTHDSYSDVSYTFKNYGKEIAEYLGLDVVKWNKYTILKRKNRQLMNKLFQFIQKDLKFGIFQNLTVKVRPNKQQNVIIDGKNNYVKIKIKHMYY